MAAGVADITCESVGTLAPFNKSGKRKGHLGAADAHHHLGGDHSGGIFTPTEASAVASGVTA